MKTMKQVILVRKDLKVQYEGKMLAQAGHGVHLLLKEKAVLEKGKGWFYPYDERIEIWESEEYTKIALAVHSEEELLELYTKAKTEGFLCSLVQDNGHTEFNGQKTLTVAVIGPDSIEKISALTGHLKLYR